MILWNVLEAGEEGAPSMHYSSTGSHEALYLSTPFTVWELSHLCAWVPERNVD